MKNKLINSRRDFIKTSAIATTALAGGLTQSCSSPVAGAPGKEPLFPIFTAAAYKPSDGYAGLLFSQVGYNTGMPVRIVIRLPEKDLLSGKAAVVLVPVTGGKQLGAKITYWGELWKSHWWVAETEVVNEPGEWNIEVMDNGETVFRDTGVIAGDNLLWNRTVEFASVDMLERRKHFTKVGAGWQDAGTLWAESPAQSAMIIALTELLDKTHDRFDETFRSRFFEQLTVGCDYLVMTQEKARELGFPDGAMSHDLLGHEKDILPHDAIKAVVALTRAVAFLPEKYRDRKDRYRLTADRAMKWLLTSARPMADKGMSKRQRGLTEDAFIPGNEWMTRDLMTFLWAWLELHKAGNLNAKDQCISFARQIMDRQIAKDNAEAGFYGHFYEYTSTKHSEKSWSHGIVNNEFGADMGGIYPNYLVPLIEILRLFPEHEDQVRWKKTLEDFTYGYLIPACKRNPFMIVPLGIFGDEGPIWFAGTFHGTNTIYSFTAALAIELSTIFNEPDLIRIAYNNLLWVAGLNAGLTRENIKEAVVFSTEVPEGAALPVSMICNIGKRWAGTWFNTRGVICNGFSVGKQFSYDEDPLRANDGPDAFTDEDWIPHSAAWLTGLTRLINSQASARPSE